MKIIAKDSSAALAPSDLIAVFGLAESKLPLPAGVSIGKTPLKDFKAGFRDQRSTDLEGSIPRALMVGLGKKSELTPDRLRRAAALAAKAAVSAGLGKVTLWLDPKLEDAVDGAEAAGVIMAEGARMATYSYDAQKSKPEGCKLKQISLCGSGTAFRKGVARGAALAEANLFARDLQNAPGNHMRPKDLAAAARKLATRSARITCKVLDEAAMRKLGMGSLLAVSRGSSEPAQLIHLTYKPKAKARAKIAFVGKGLTFDAGGISIKPSGKMDEMKYDMSGGAAVLGAFHALGDLDVPFEVHGVVAASENLPDGAANKPGDVLKAMNGTTIEVLNTDAEGRLILADALCYTISKIKPDTVLDLATLTGAVVVALGHELTGIFPSTESLRDDLIKAGDNVGEACWPLPLLDCHRDQVKSKIADIKNLNGGEGNGSTAGAAFLANFVGDTEWCHLDIAGTAWGAANRDYTGGPQGTGVGVRLLMEYLEVRP